MPNTPSPPAVEVAGAGGVVTLAGKDGTGAAMVAAVVTAPRPPNVGTAGAAEVAGAPEGATVVVVAVEVVAEPKIDPPAENPPPPNPKAGGLADGNPVAAPPKGEGSGAAAGVLPIAVVGVAAEVDVEGAVALASPVGVFASNTRGAIVDIGG